MNKKDREQIVNRFWTECKTDENNVRQREKRAFDFYKSTQWDKEDTDKLDAQQRPHLTFNFIKSIIRNLCGYQRQNRQSTKVLARKGGRELLAQAFTEVIKYFEDISDSQWAESFAFFYGIVGGRGFIGLDIDFTDDPLNGDLVIQNEDPDGIREDPFNREYDLNKGRYVFREAWKEKEEIELLFPGEELGDLTLLPTEDVKYGKGDDYRDVQRNDSKTPTRPVYRLKECWWRTYEKTMFFFNPATLQVKQIPAENKKEIAAFRDELLLSDQTFQEVERVIPVLNLTTLIGDKVLQDIKDPFNGIIKYPVVRFCPDFINGYIKGEVEDLETPQQEVNKRNSQLLHHLNQSANSGWKGDMDTLGEAGCTRWEDLEANTSKPGFIIKTKAGKSQNLTRIEPVSLSEGHLILARNAPEIMKRISGVNPDMLGEVSDPNISGIAMQRRTAQGLITTEIIHDNWRYTKKILGETLLEFIRKEDIISEIELENIIKEQQLQVNVTDLLAAMKERAVGKYGVVVSLAPTSATAKLDNFMALTELARNNIPIPPEVLVAESLISEGSKELIRQKLTPPAPAKVAEPQLTAV
ncbi:MAG: hypothetical protein QME51_01735 [Planctomycetota bacterium]|nr:hypothetical protein [Planctomycetota bacterium]